MGIAIAVTKWCYIAKGGGGGGSGGVGGGGVGGGGGGWGQKKFAAFAQTFVR